MPCLVFVRFEPECRAESLPPRSLAEQLQGNTKARAGSCYRLVEAYIRGNGVEKDQSEAVKWLIKASELGHAEAQCDLGILYVVGGVVAQSDDKAF